MEPMSLTAIEEYLYSIALELPNFAESSDSLKAELMNNIFCKFKDDFIKKQLRQFKQSKKELKGVRKYNDAFDKRLFNRWKPAFDRLELMIEIATEIGQSHSHDIKDDESISSSKIIIALNHIYPKSLLILREILCLMKGGFADGALTRWRSLHELAVTALYIEKHGEEIAHRYLLSHNFSMLKFAEQINEYSGLIPEPKFTEDEIEYLKRNVDLAKQILGEPNRKNRDGEWPKILKSHTDFAAIEKDVGLDHMRPYYHWSSQYIHSNHRLKEQYLGLIETSENVHLVGKSNGGLVLPFYLSATTMSLIFNINLRSSINFDRLIYIGAYKILADEIRSIAIKAEKDSKAAFDKKNMQI